MSLAFLFHFLCVQHVLDINLSIIRSLRLCCWITTSVVLFLFRCVLEIWCGCICVVSVLQATPTLIQQHSCKLLMMDILVSEICWAHKKWNKVASDIMLVFYSSAMNRCLRKYFVQSAQNGCDKICLYIQNCKKNHEHYQSDQTVLVEIFKPLISGIRSRNLKNYLAILCETREDEICWLEPPYSARFIAK